MTDEDIEHLFTNLLGLEEDFDWLLANRPLLAHYTSISVLEKIMKDEEVWFSNPLFMNDMEEMRFGLNLGRWLFENSKEVDEAASNPERAQALRHYFRYYYEQFEQQHALNVYVFCLTEHDPGNTDGLLSMWRGYGGQGSGCALIFNTKFVVKTDDSPLIFAKITYASGEQRKAFLVQKLCEWRDVVKAAAIPTDKLHIPAYHFFHVVKMFALTSKHHGFQEEREWRVIYMPDHDRQHLLSDSFGYIVNNRGVEPKLKFKLKPLRIESPDGWTFADILDRILLGPSQSTPLALHSVRCMLERIGKPAFCEKVFPSSIPLRPT